MPGSMPSRSASPEHEPLGVVERAPAGSTAPRRRSGRIAPQRLAVAAPVERERPARQLLARIPFALAVVEEPAGREAVPAAGGSGRRRGRAWSGPTAAVFHSAPSRSSIETKVGSPPMVSRTSPACSRASIALAGGQDLLHSLLGVGLGDARLLDDPRHAHLEAELDLARVDGTGDRGGASAGRACRPAGCGLRRPAGPRSGRGRSSRRREVDLGPGMQVGEVLLGAGRAVERPHVGLELDQVAGDEAGGEAQMAQDLHQQPGRIAARAGAQGQRLLAGSGCRAPCG